MTRFHSLLDYLDDVLPWSLTISLQNFFSFLPFVDPVDERISTLRKAVDKAKDSNSFDYCDFYKAYALPTKNDFQYSVAEQNYLAKQAEAPQTTDSTKAPSSETKPKPVPSAVKIVQNLAQSKQADEELDALVNKILTFAHKKHWQQLLAAQIINLEIPVIKQLARKLIEKSELPCASFLIKDMQTRGESWEAVKESVFNKLQRKKDIQCYDRYLSYKWDKYTTVLAAINYRDEFITQEGLRLQSAIDKKLVSTDYPSQLSKKRIIHMKERITDFSKKNKISESYIASLCRILDKMSVFLSGVTDEEAQLLSKYHTKREKQLRERNKLDEERIEFRQKLVRYEINAVSEQRLIELFGSDAPKIARQCQLYGAFVFDARDKAAVTTVLSEQAEMKSLGF